MDKKITNSGESGELLVKAKLVKMMMEGQKFIDGSKINQVDAGDFKSKDGRYTYNQDIDESSINEDHRLPIERKAEA